MADRPSPRPVFLLGMMGAGKSSVGALLASRLRASFIDLDRRIERLFARSIPALFAVGEDHFRARERAALRSLLAEPGFAGRSVVVATGGGVVVDASNLEAMAAAGVTVYLAAEVATLVARLSTAEQQRRRPLLASAELERRLGELLAAREQTYRRADHVVDAGVAVDEVVTAVARALGRAPA